MLMQATTRESLRAHPLFVAFDDDTFDRLAAGATLVVLDAGQILFQRGDPARAFFIVLGGQVKLFMQSRAGDEKILALEQPGQSFGEAVMFMQGPMYPVSAAATEPTSLVSMPTRDYMQALRDDVNTCLRLLGVLSQRLHTHVQEIEELTLESAGNRLVRHLLRRAAPDSEGHQRVHFDETRQMLASQLAIKPETLSRLTRTLADAGLIELDGRDILIPDPRRLEAWGDR
jgi:CRP-like cAMP-binding protein